MNELLNRRITAVRDMTQVELEAEGWEATSRSAVALDLDDGTTLYASMDEEGNGPGALFGYKAGEQFLVVVREV